MARHIAPEVDRRGREEHSVRPLELVVYDVKAKAEDAISAVRRSDPLMNRGPPLLKEKTVVPLFFGDAAA